eukprot:5375461-Lingulodinium_polyedra.AAC.1
MSALISGSRSPWSMMAARPFARGKWLMTACPSRRCVLSRKARLGEAAPAGTPATRRCAFQDATRSEIRPPRRAA